MNRKVLGKSSILDEPGRHHPDTRHGIVSLPVLVLTVLVGWVSPGHTTAELVDAGIYSSARIDAPSFAAAKPGPAAPVVVAPRPLPQGWAELRKGMSRDDALEQVGEPRWEEKTLAYDFWMYQVQSIMGSGVLVFDGNRLRSWRPPDGPFDDPTPGR